MDDAFPERLRHRLRDACSSFLLVGGPLEFLDLGAIGVVGSRDASPEALEVAASTSTVAAASGMAVVSGLARGIDQTAMAAALDAVVPVVGVPTEGIRWRLAIRDQAPRMPVNCASPAMGRPCASRPATRW
jgi:predicted Rossmann fold nucleotide-binding protein DprA/Smf involved in DNA uptake